MIRRTKWFLCVLNLFYATLGFASLTSEGEQLEDMSAPFSIVFQGDEWDLCGEDVQQNAPRPAYIQLPAQDVEEGQDVSDIASNLSPAEYCRKIVDLGMMSQVRQRHKDPLSENLEKLWLLRHAPGVSSAQLENLAQVLDLKLDKSLGGKILALRTGYRYLNLTKRFLIGMAQSAAVIGASVWPLFYPWSLPDTVPDSCRHAYYLLNPLSTWQGDFSSLLKNMGTSAYVLLPVVAYLTHYWMRHCQSNESYVFTQVGQGLEFVENKIKQNSKTLRVRSLQFLAISTFIAANVGGSLLLDKYLLPGVRAIPGETISLTEFNQLTSSQSGCCVIDQHRIAQGCNHAYASLMSADMFAVAVDAIQYVMPSVQETLLTQLPVAFVLLHFLTAFLGWIC